MSTLRMEAYLLPGSSRLKPVKTELMIQPGCFGPTDPSEPLQANDEFDLRELEFPNSLFCVSRSLKALRLPDKTE